jgi:hypothetical protein
MANAFDALAKDHEEVKRMLAELELGPTTATGADPDQLALRKKMVQHLVIEEAKHEAVEEMYFWPVVRKAPATTAISPVRASTSPAMRPVGPAPTTSTSVSVVGRSSGLTAVTGHASHFGDGE